MNKSILGSQTLEFIWGCHEFVSSLLLQILSNGFGKPNVCVNSSSDCGSSLRDLENIWECCLYSLETLLQLADIGGELLAKSDWGSILGVGSTNLHDVLKFILLGSETFGEPLEAWNKSLIGLKDSSNMHDSWEGIIRRL